MATDNPADTSIPKFNVSTSSVINDDKTITATIAVTAEAEQMLSLLKSGVTIPPESLQQALFALLPDES